MITTTVRRGLLAAVMTAVATLGTTTAASAASAEPVARPVAAKADTWEWAGSYPEPIVCNIAGATSGRDWYCSWSFLWWDLYLRS
jgi:hypothetical protein